MSQVESGCSDALAKVYLYLDGEMPDGDCDTLRQHLDECGDCLREFGLEHEFKALIARTCGCDPAPEELRTRLLGRLREVRLEISHVEFRAD